VTDPIAFCRVCCCIPHRTNCPDRHIPILGTFAACASGGAHEWKIVRWKNGCLETLHKEPGGAMIGAPRITASPALMVQCFGPRCRAWGWADGSPADWDALSAQMLDAPFGGKSIMPFTIPNPIPYTGPVRETPEPEPPASAIPPPNVQKQESP
jgi:hypothetical protein